MPHEAMASEEWESFRLSLARDDMLFRLQRRIGLIPAQGSGLPRRMAFWVAVTWLPLAVWAVLSGRAFGGEVAEPLLVHFTIHARLLLGIPALHLAEAMSQGVLGMILPYFVTSGLVPAARVPAYREVLHGIARLRDQTLPWIIISALALASSYYFTTASQADEMSWAVNPDGSLAFGAWWMAVGRVVYLVLGVGWLWRAGLVFLLLWRVSRLGLALVPTHADKVAGLGFLERLPTMFAPVVFALSAVISAYWGHQVLYHGAHVTDLRGPMVVFLAMVLLIFLAPNLAFAPLLIRTKAEARLQLGTLVGRYGRMTQERWVLGREVEEPGMLGAPELGPVCDVNALYEPVQGMRPVPIGLPTLAAVLVPAGIPMLGVLALEVPIKELLGAVAKALM
jgi:hypothetical protein